MTKRQVAMLKDIDDTIDYWEKQRIKLKTGLSGLGRGQVIFCDDYSKINGFYDRCDIPVEIALEVVIEKLDLYLHVLKKYRRRIEIGNFDYLIEIVRGYIPKII